MDLFLTYVLIGLSMGSVYALVALGLVIIFKSTEVINFAYPAQLIFGVWLVASVAPRYGFGLAVLIGATVLVASSILLYWIFMRRFEKTNSVLAASVLTIGLAIVMKAVLDHKIGSDILSIAELSGNRLVDVFGLTIPRTRVVAIMVAASFVILLSLWLHRSTFGVRIRSAAEDPETAELMGVSLARVASLVWGLAAGIALVAGLFLISYPVAGLDINTYEFALNAVPAAVIGGLDSTTGAIVGGLLVGLTSVLVQGYQEQLAFLGRSFNVAAPYLLMLIVLLIRPAGLFGVKELSRV